VIADKFIGRALPQTALPATCGGSTHLAKVQGWCVLFAYPYTGRPGFADPPNWDDITGAHGSTPQALAFSNSYGSFEKLNVKVFGLSLCSAEWQSEFVARNQLRIPLLSDEAGSFSDTLGLPRFNAGAREFLSRITLIVKAAKIELAYVPDPQADADFCLGWLKSNT
jgi:peroxiredoxin